MLSSLAFINSGLLTERIWRDGTATLLQIRRIVRVCTPQDTMTTPSANRVQVVVLRMALTTESCVGVLAPRASFTIPAPSTLRPLSISVGHSSHQSFLPLSGLATIMIILQLAGGTLW